LQLGAGNTGRFFAGTFPTGETLGALHQLPLEYLDLADCPLTEQGFAQIATLKNLKALDLTWTKITDAEIEALAPLRSLRLLKLDCTEQSSIAGPTNLSRALPNCSIHYSTNCPHY
jgi:Leucine-rich repeat (LRR) protein